jgi:tRNA(Leu) C34 or U34 (ribose-2'-O)-methylase TrmL
MIVPKVETSIWGKNNPHGKAPSIVLINPKYPRNVGMAIRLASCYAFKQVWFTGKRVSLDGKNGRLPREERMKGYKEIELINHDYVFDQFHDVTPVAIEVRENAIPLPMFEHPKNPIYIFGPEDGSIDSVHLRHCHNFVVIPTRHCLNLATSIATILWDRQYKLMMQGDSNGWTPGEWEHRGVFKEFDIDEYGEPNT